MKRGKQAKKLYELLNITKEELESIIPLLCESHQQFLKDNFDDDYKRIILEKWPEEKNVYFHSVKRSLLNMIFNLKNNTIRNYRNIILLLGISKEKMDTSVKYLSIEEQQFIFKYFDDDYNFKPEFKNISEEEKRFYHNKVLNDLKQIVGYIRPSKRPLYQNFGLSKEDFIKIYSKLSEKSKEIINKCYDDNFLPLPNCTLDKKEKRYYQSFTVRTIKSHISSVNMPHYSLSNLPDKFGVSKEDFEIMLNYLNTKGKIFISKYYDNNYVLKEDVPKDEYQKLIYIIRLLKVIKDELAVDNKDLKKQVVNIDDYLLLPDSIFNDNSFYAALKGCSPEEAIVLIHDMKNKLIIFKEKLARQIETLDNEETRLIRNKKEV